MELDEILKSKFSNIYIMLLYAIISRDIAKVKQFLSDDLCIKYTNQINELVKNNEIQMYDELNVKDIYINSKEEHDDKYVVDVTLISRYMDYVIDNDTKKYKRGINDHRIELTHHLVFEKLKTATGINGVIKCPNCGANMNINYHGKCEFCGQVIDAKTIDYKLVRID